MRQMRIYERENKLNIRPHVLHLRFLWQRRSIKKEPYFKRKASVWSPLTVAALFPLIVGSLWASIGLNVSACSCCLLFLPPRCRTPGLLLSSRCRWCHWLFGHRHQLNPLTNAALLLAAVAGVASCQIVHHYSGVVFQETVQSCDLVRDSCYFYTFVLLCCCLWTATAI